MKIASIVLAGASILGLSSHVWAVASSVVPSVANNAPFPVSSSDLLQTDVAGTPVATGDFTYGGKDPGVPILTDGQFKDAGAVFAQTALTPAGNTLTYTLSNPLGYNITNINTYSGWDDFLGGQAYTVAYDTVALPGTYVPIATVNYDPYNGLSNPNGNTSTQVLISDVSGLLAVGARSIQFTFAGIPAGPAGFRELDVIGSAVPEPSTLALLGLGGLGLLARRRA